MGQMKLNRKLQPKPAAALNIRNFPDELRWLCRERANQERMSLRQFVIVTLKRATEEEGMRS
jgi:hypothetical protein